MNLKVSKKLLIMLLLALAGLLIAVAWEKPDLVSAQSVDALSINISPPVSYLYVKPGAKINSPIFLENQGRYALRLEPHLVDFKAHPQTGQVILQKNSDFKYLSIAGDDQAWGRSFIIKPGESYTLPLTLAVPNDFPQDEYYLSVLLNIEQMMTADAEKDAGTLLSGVLASHLIVVVSLDETDRSQVVLKDFKLPKLVDSLMGINFEIWVNNIGLNAGAIRGQLSLSHWPSAREEIYEFYPDMVLAGGQRQVRGMSQENLQQLKNLSEQEQWFAANNQDIFELQSVLLEESLVSDFSYKKPFLFGAYDFYLTLGGEERVERVVALPFSIILVIMVLPVLYRLFTLLIKLSIKNEK